jgi:hypothetical protein
MNGFSSVASTATQTGTTIADVFGYGASAASSGAGAASSVSGILGAASSALSGIVGAVAGIVGAVAGIIGDIQTVHTQNILSDIEKETARMAIYLGDQGGNSILGLMWRLVGDIEFGVMEKGILALSTTGLQAINDIEGGLAYFEKEALSSLGEIDIHTGSILIALQKGINVGVGSGGAGTYASGTLANPPNAPGQDAVTAAQQAAAQASESSAVAAQVLQNVTDLVQSDQNKYGTLASGYNALQETLDQAAQVLATREATLAADVGSNASQQQIDIDQQKVILAAQAVQQAQLKLAQDKQGAAASEQLAADQERLTQAQNAANAAQSGSTAAATLAAQEAAAESYVSAEQAYQDISKILDNTTFMTTALQNINNGIVACAGWLQGIAGYLAISTSTAGSGATVASLNAVATYIGANFTSLENWLFSAFGKTMALPALPGPIAIPAGLGGAAVSGSGGLTINMTNTVNGSVVGQNGMNQFANGIGNTIVNRLRGAGMKY